MLFYNYLYYCDLNKTLLYGIKMDKLDNIQQQLKELTNIVTNIPINDRALCVKKLAVKLGISESGVYALEDLPKPITIGKGSTRWRESEINQYIRDKPHKAA